MAGTFCWVQQLPPRVSIWTPGVNGMQPQYPIPWRRSGASGLGDAGVGSLRF